MPGRLSSFSLLLISCMLLFSIGVESIAPISELDVWEWITPSGEAIDVESIAPTDEAIISGLQTGDSVAPMGKAVDILSTEAMDKTDQGTSHSVGYFGRRIYLITCNPPKGRNPRAFYLEILTKIIGGEKAARRAFFYNKIDGNRFGARLTSRQAKHLARVPGVTSIRPEIPIYLPN